MERLGDRAEGLVAGEAGLGDRAEGLVAGKAGLVVLGIGGRTGLQSR